MIPTPSLPLTGTRLYILSGQHGVKALLELREKWIAEGHGEMPLWLRVVRADILKHKTPLPIRQMIAGDEQYRQQNVSRVKVSEFLRHLWQWKPVGRRTEMWQRIADSLVKAGWSRPDNQVCSLCLPRPRVPIPPPPFPDCPPAGLPPPGGLLR